MPPQMAEPVPFFQADAAEEEAAKAAQAALEAAMRASEEAARKAAEEAAKKAAILAAEQAAILAAEEAAKKAAEEAARKAAEDAALKAAASSPGMPEAVALPWPNLPMTRAKGGPPQRPAGARPVVIPWKSSPQKRQAETQDVFAMHQVNRPPPVPAKKQKTSPRGEVRGLAAEHEAAKWVAVQSGGARSCMALQGLRPPGAPGHDLCQGSDVQVAARGPHGLYGSPWSGPSVQLLRRSLGGKKEFGRSGLGLHPKQKQPLV